MDMYQMILLPTDGSENSKRAGKHAIWIANESGADIVVLNVIDVNYLQPPNLPSFRGGLDKALREESKRAVQDFKDDLEESQCRGICKNINLITRIKEGKSHVMILETIDEEDIDLLVIGASGRHGVDRFMLGSVTDRVLGRVRIPVLVVS